MVNRTPRSSIRCSALAVAALVSIASPGCLLIYGEVADDQPSGGNDSTSSSVGGAGPVGPGGAGGGGAMGGGGAGGGCIPPGDPPLDIVDMNCPGFAVAASPNGVFVARDGCNGPPGNPTVIHYGADLQNPSSYVGLINATGQGMVAQSEVLVLYAATGGEILACNVNDFSCSSVSAGCLGKTPCDKPWGGLAKLTNNAFVGVQKSPTPDVFRFNASGNFSSLTTNDFSPGIGYDVDGFESGSQGTFTIAWTNRAADDTSGSVQRISTAFALGVASSQLQDPPSGVAVGLDGTVFLRVEQRGGGPSKLWVWPPQNNGPTPFTPAADIVGPPRAHVALHRASNVIYLNGFIDQQAPPETVYRCACGECTAADIDCGTVGGIDVDQATGRAYFTCDTRIVRF